MNIEGRKKFDKLYARLQRLIGDGDALRRREPMNAHTSFRVGGPAEILVMPKTAEELSSIIKEVDDCGVPYYIMGGGTNLIVRDGGIRAVIIKLCPNMAEVCFDGLSISAQAGASLMAVARMAAHKCMAGLEFAGGIPGTVGGGAYMNAGAYGGELCQVVKRVEVLTENGVETIDAADFDFGYRTSLASKKGLIVTRCFMELQENGQDALVRMNEFNARRRAKQPLSYPSAGSVFKRPVGHFAGALIEGAGMKGEKIGGAQVSTLHAGFIINAGGASAADAIRLMEKVKAAVFERYGVELEPEWKIAGEE
ncbi:MAG: UDP-N-acetylmuramate dehydrogenase [Christensenellales bacterium]|jgi:UDP-N-acetylmuramate dehydrogenase